jgi:hypothetical protein
MATDIKESLTQKVGPLPAYGWGLILGGGYVGYRYWKAKQAAAASAASPTSVVDTQGTGFGLSQDAASPWGNAGGGGSSVVNPTGTGTTTTGSQTNVDWGNMAENWAIAMGFNPTDAATAIGSYLYGTGQALNSTQSGILQQVLRQFGTPPEGIIIPPPVTAPPPINPTPSAPTQQQPPSPTTGGGFTNPLPGYGIQTPGTGTHVPDTSPGVTNSPGMSLVPGYGYQTPETGTHVPGQ